MSSSMKLGFIGIGLMGKPMALRLLDAGFTVNVWNRSAEKLPAVVAHGAQACSSIAELLRLSDVILLCLADTVVVEQIVNSAIKPAISSGKSIIDLSSIAPDRTRAMAQSMRDDHQSSWVDAPVSGGVKGAQEGTLAIMAGGEAQDIEIARLVLAPLYKQLTHMGPVGSGQATKICNQMIVSCNMLVIAEMMAMAQKAGIATDKIPAALAGGFADSLPLQISGMDMANGDFASIKWRVKTLLKDLSMANQLAKDTESATPMSGLAKQLMQLHAGQGFAEQDPATLIKMFQHDNKP